MKQNTIILASTSPRRIEMVKKYGINPVMIAPCVDESIPSEMTMEQAVMYLALKKALSAENKWLRQRQNGLPDLPIIAADTVVYKNGIIGKPTDKSDAISILSLLKNTNHYVATGVAILYPGSTKREVFYEKTEVFFNDYSKEEILEYVATGEPFDKAGAYAIQGGWSKQVSHIVGDYDNVVGFPWGRIQNQLESILNK